MATLLKPSLLRPKHPERVCWGCDKYCAVGDLSCGNGSERTPHPIELFGEDWLEWAEQNHPSEDDRVLPGLREPPGLAVR